MGETTQEEREDILFWFSDQNEEEIIPEHVVSSIYGVVGDVERLRSRNEALEAKLKWAIDKWVDDADPAECYPEMDEALQLLTPPDSEPAEGAGRDAGAVGGDGTWSRNAPRVCGRAGGDMSEATPKMRHEFRVYAERTGDEEMQVLVRDADRLAQIERQVIYRTADMPNWAEVWEKCRNGQCLWDARDAKAPEIAPDLRPDEPGPLWLPIIDPPEDT